LGLGHKTFFSGRGIYFPQKAKKPIGLLTGTLREHKLKGGGLETFFKVPTYFGATYGLPRVWDPKNWGRTGGIFSRPF